MIGVNRYMTDESGAKIEIHPYDATTAERQIARTRGVRANRNETRVQTLLDELVDTVRDESANLMLVTIELVKQGATMGDIVGKLKGLWGVYREKPVF